MTDRHEHLDEGTIHAWLDGALPPDESARVEAAANSCAECSALVAEARGLIAASSRILSSLDTVPSGVIPGGSGNVDQLAALRARNVRTKRHWWNDRRIVAAASIVFVAGVSTMVWRSTPEGAKSPLAEQVTADAVRPFADSANTISASAPAPSVPSPGNDAASQAREAPARKVEEPASPPAPVATRAADMAAEQKVAATTSTGRGAAANEAKLVDSSIAQLNRQAESRRELSRADALSPVQQQSLRQQGAVGQQQGLQQLRPDTMRVNAPPPSFGARSRTAPSVGAASAIEACYRLRSLTGQNERLVPDTVQLLNEVLPVERDPAWFRVRTFGTVRDTTFVWRLLDSITVQLRDGMGSGRVIVYFVTTGPTQDLLNRSADARVAASERISCP
jgi:hypothetical protein